MMMMVPFVLQSWTAHHNGDDVVIMLMAMMMVTAFCKAGLRTMMTMMIVTGFHLLSDQKSTI